MSVVLRDQSNHVKCPGLNGNRNWAKLADTLGNIYWITAHYSQTTEQHRFFQFYFKGTPWDETLSILSIVNFENFIYMKLYNI